MTGRPTLITGATGFAGGHLLNRLADRTPLVSWHRPDHAPADATEGVSWQAVDILDRHAVVRSIHETQPSRIFHLAGASRVDTSWDSVVPHLQTNALGTHHLLESVRDLGTHCRVLVVSSAMIYDASRTPIGEDSLLRPSNPYGLSKLAQDQLARRAATDDGLDVVLARPFNHIGPRQHPSFAVSSFARQIALIEAGRADPELHVGNLEAQRDVTDVRDVIEAYEGLMELAPAGRPYNICSGQSVRIGALLELLLRQSAASIRLVVDPSRLRPNDIPVFSGDPSRIRTEVGWTPRRSLPETLLDTLNWWREEVARTLEQATPGTTFA